MDPLDFFEPEDLLRFFHCKKTEISCMDNPHTFLTQLRDHNLVSEDRYKKVSRMKSKENMKKAIYNILDWLEEKQAQHIKVFWKCVFKETIVNQYPTLRLLRNSLMDGSFRDDMQLPESVEEEETYGEKRKEISEDEEKEEKQENSVKKKRKQRSRSMCDDDEEQPGPSSQLTPAQKKKSKKICYASPVRKGEKSDVWNWPIFKYQLPVTCGDLEGTLNRDRLAKGEKCILFEKKWFTPGEFEKRAGKQSSKNWKLSIRCHGTPLGKLIEEGHLKSVTYKRRFKKAKKPLFPSDHVISVSDTEEDEDENEHEKGEDKEDQVSSNNKESSTDDTDEEDDTDESEPNHDSSKTVFKVTCGALTGTLHKKRFASGNCGKSIRTETSWMSPVEFVRESLCQRDVSWKKDIKCEGEPLSVLIEQNILKIHSLLCTCSLCKPDQNDLDNQKNDDECSVCKSDEEAELVVCDHCPRSFHQKCHLPHIEDSILRDDRPWLCTFCVFRTTREWCYSEELEMQAAMSRQVSRHMLECQYLLLHLWSADEEQTFSLNPDLYLSDYSTVIQTPMWFGKVANKLQEKGYQTVGDFVSDVQLIFTNCAKYNRNNAEFLAEGDQLKKLFDREFKNVFNICG